MGNLVMHFELHGSNPQQLIDFYPELLGWTFTRFGEVEYWTIDTGPTAIGNVAGVAGHGINGGLIRRHGPDPRSVHPSTDAGPQATSIGQRSPGGMPRVRGLTGEPGSS